jgi:hypothetical protein
MTRSGFIDKWMIGLFFPTMASSASCLDFTPILVFSYEGTSLPIKTEVKGIIVEQVRLASEVLVVMGVITLSLVVFLIVGAPFSLEVEHKVVSVF